MLKAYLCLAVAVAGAVAGALAFLMMDAAGEGPMHSYYKAPSGVLAPTSILWQWMAVIGPVATGLSLQLLYYELNEQEARRAEGAGRKEIMEKKGSDSEMSRPENDPFRAFEGIEDQGAVAGWLTAQRESVIAANEMKKAQARAKRYEARVVVNEAASRSAQSAMPAMGNAARAAIGKAVMDEIRADPRQFAPPPVGPGTPSLPSSSPSPLPPPTVLTDPINVLSPVQAALSPEEIEGLVISGAAQCGDDKFAWMRWSDDVRARYPAQHEAILQTAERMLRKGAARIGN